MTSSRPSRRVVAALALLVASLAPGCVVDYPLVNDLLSFEVVLSPGAGEQPTGSEDDRLAFVSGGVCVSDASCPDGQVCVAGPEGSICAVRYVLDITAYGRDGDPFAYRGPLMLRATPGVLAGGHTSLFMDGERMEGLEVFLARSFGHTHLWVEADGYWSRPDSASYGQCSDGVDNDANGLVDLADPGCRDETDDIEAPVSLASGVSPSLWFANPNLQDLQRADPIVISTSPLVGEQVQISRGNLVVTNVVNNGFYVVDLEHNVADELFTSLFVFTYSKPKDLLYGDKLCGFSGAVQEHVGHTQVVFPTFEVYPRDSTVPHNEACDDFPGLDPEAQIPDPWDVTAALIKESRTDSDYKPNVWANSQLLEAHESNLVTFRDVTISTRFIACDRNGDGKISGNDEKTCRNACTQDSGGVLCTDLEGYFEFAQYAGLAGTDKKKIYGSVALAASFKPLDIETIGGPDLSGRCTVDTTDDGFIEYLCEPLTLAHLTGSLRHIYLCGSYGTEDTCDLQFWVIDPRFDDDVVIAQPTGSIP